MEYTIEHTLSVERIRSRRHGMRGGHMAQDMLDCFVRLVEALNTMPTENYVRVGNVLWISKDVAVSISVLQSAAPEAIAAFKKTVPEGVRKLCDAETTELLRECCLTHDFFDYAVRSAIFDDAALFRDGFHFVSRLLQRARSLKKPLTRLELLYAAATPPTWNMLGDMNPWERTWTSPRVKYHPGLFYDGQRRVATLFGCGDTLQHRQAENAWVRCLAPWVSAEFVNEHAVDENDTPFSSSRSPRVEKVAFFLKTVAAFSSFPEAFELCVEAWRQSSQTLRNLLKKFPHLQRVVLRVLRYRRECEPPRHLCEAIVREATKQTTEGGPTKKFSRKTIRAWARDERVETVANALREEGCEEAALRVETFGSQHVDHVAWSFELPGAHGHVTWVDVVTSKNAWDTAHGEEATEIARTTNRAYVVTTERDVSFYRHPLSKLLIRDTDHPFSVSRMPELLAACA